MCLTIKEGDKPKEAKKPIICYKVGLVLSGKFRTNHHAYELGTTTNKLAIGVEADKRRLYFTGVHTKEINIGYHSLNNYYQSWKCPFEFSESTGLFIIPRGSTYYDGFMNDYLAHLNRVSDQIVWLGSPWSPLAWLRAVKYFITD